MSISELLKIEQIKLGNRIVYIRKLFNLTQKKLANNSGLSTRVLRRLEKGESNSEFKTLFKIAQGMQIKIECLFDYNNEYEIIHQSESNQEFEFVFSVEKKKIGTQILQLCKIRNINQEDLSVLSKIATSDLSVYIKGEENLVLFTLLKLSVGLEVRIHDLLNYDSASSIYTNFIGKSKF